MLQYRFDDTAGSRPFRLLGHPRFRAAYDFLLLRAEADDIDSELAQWWQHFVAANDTERKSMTHTGSGSTRTTNRKRRKKPGAPRNESTAT